MKKIDTPWVAQGSRVYFARTAGGFDLRNCPDSHSKANFLVVAVNHHEKAKSLIKAFLNAYDKGDEPNFIKEAKQLLADLANFERWYAALPTTLDDLKLGDKVIVDAGFDCIEPWSVHEVEEDVVGKYIRCNHVYHYLDAQMTFDHTLAGVRKING